MSLKKVSFEHEQLQYSSVSIYIFHLFVFFCFLCMSLLLHPQDYKTGFGGQFGVQKDRVDASAAGWDHVEKVAKHPSQQGRNGSQCMYWWWKLEGASITGYLYIFCMT